LYRVALKHLTRREHLLCLQAFQKLVLLVKAGLVARAIPAAQVILARVAAVAERLKLDNAVVTQRHSSGGVVERVAAALLAVLAQGVLLSQIALQPPDQQAMRGIQVVLEIQVVREQQQPVFL
jgi:hypothetical protein